MDWGPCSPWVGYSPWGCKESDMTGWLYFLCLYKRWVPNLKHIASPERCFGLRQCDFWLLGHPSSFVFVVQMLIHVQFYVTPWTSAYQAPLSFTAAAAAAAKSLQSCPTLCDPIDGSPPGSAVPAILQAGTLEWVAISFSNAWKGKVKVKSLSRSRFFATPRSAAYQAPPSMGFSRQEYWSGVPLPSLAPQIY